jgi:hypothetical protein
MSDPTVEREAMEWAEKVATAIMAQPIIRPRIAESLRPLLAELARLREERAKEAQELEAARKILCGAHQWSLAAGQAKPFCLVCALGESQDRERALKGELSSLKAEHEERVKALLEANTREVERRQGVTAEAEAQIAANHAALDAAGVPRGSALHSVRYRIGLLSEDFAEARAEVERLKGERDHWETGYKSVQRRYDETGAAWNAAMERLSLAEKLARRISLMRTRLVPDDLAALDALISSGEGVKEKSRGEDSRRCNVMIHDHSDSYHGGHSCGRFLPCPDHPVCRRDKNADFCWTHHVEGMHSPAQPPAQKPNTDGALFLGDAGLNDAPEAPKPPEQEIDTKHRSALKTIEMLNETAARRDALFGSVVAELTEYRRLFGSEYETHVKKYGAPSATLQQEIPKDRCEFCRGEKGGTPGNENVVEGIVVCDFCTAKLLPITARITSLEGENKAIVEALKELVPGIGDATTHEGVIKRIAARIVTVQKDRDEQERYIDTLEGENAKLRAFRDVAGPKLRNAHTPYASSDPNHQRVCRECSKDWSRPPVPWPCPPIAALDATEGKS